MKEMMKEFNRLTFLKKISFLFILALLITLPVVAFIAQQPKDINSEAAEPVSNSLTPTPTPLLNSHIQIINPNGGDSLINGSVYPITWTSSKDIAYVNINIKDDLGNTAWVVTGLGNPKIYDWVVNNKGLTGNQYKLRLSAYDVNYRYFVVDESDNYFTIPDQVPTLTPTSTLTPSPSPTKIPVRPSRYLGPPVKDY